MATYRKTFVTASNIIGTISADKYLAIGSGGTSSGVADQYTTTQSRSQVKFYAAETLSKLRCYVNTNAHNNNFLVNIQVNGSSVNQAITIATTATGVFEDTSNTDVIASGDLVNYFLDAVGTGNIDFYWFAVDASGSLAYEKVTIIDPTGVTVSAASATTVYQPYGRFSAIGNPMGRISVAGTAKNLNCNIVTNGRSTTTTLAFRLNGGAVNQTIPVTAASTGRFEDVSNTDTVAAADNFQYQVTTGTGTGNFTISQISGEIHGSTNSINRATYVNTSIATNTTAYLTVGGFLSLANTTEAKVEITMRGSGTFRNLRVAVGTNTANQTTTVTVRKNNADTALTLGITASTGSVDFTDSSNSFTYAAGDKINFKVTRASGGSGSCGILTVAVEQAPDNDAAGVVIPVFMNQYRQRGN